MVRSSRCAVTAVALIIGAICAASPASAKKHGGGGGGYSPPAAPVQSPAAMAMEADQKEIATDQVALTKANKDYNDAAAKLTVDFEKTSDVLAAKKALADAAAEAQTARQKALDALPDNSPYKIAAAKEKAAKAELAALRDADSPDKDAISAKATEVFDDGNVTSKLERAALDADPAYAAANKNLAGATAALAALRTKFKDGLKTDDSLATVRTARDDAQTKLAAAQAKLESDRKGGTATASGG